ncbi:MAG: ATP-binding protein [Bullifex sp.]
MSHQGCDFLTEAVMNSIEARASSIVIECIVEREYVFISVKDNGEGLKCSDAFGDGVSTRGNGRGRGLYLLKTAAEDADIRDTGSGTLLRFRFKKGKMGYLSSVLPYVFSFAGVSVSFTMKRGSQIFTLESEGLEKELGELSRVGAIAEIRKKSLKADELLEET